MSDDAPTTQPSASRRALVVRGGWTGHSPVEASDSFLPFLREQGFEVAVEDSPEVYADAGRMAATDLVVQCVTMSEISREALAGLMAAVEAGTGLGGWHGGIADSYRNSAAYLHLVGGQFAEHPGKHPDERVGDASDNYVPYTVELTEAGREHPVTAGLGTLSLTTEQYWVLTDDYVDVLATTTQAVRPWDPWTRPVTSPAVWTRQWGKGRIFVATPGHSMDVLDQPEVRGLIERGLLWAAR
ncbi:ThuA domain-containing protein [Microlunatus capsulatus]|uniref:Type 1 glutamine amidotransferase n=1 Tax=Microlunatus capsulatus TaxID=99117 RepID=A0ABS4ZAN9_9ACTN|nr:ThuA domain-containing protein [Microlunatus capsulatus]MBP2417825.1 type 1 glutamine amidotransferase [Microlunatus capsulatus]